MTAKRNDLREDAMELTELSQKLLNKYRDAARTAHKKADVQAAFADYALKNTKDLPPESIFAINKLSKKYNRDKINRAKGVNLANRKINMVSIKENMENIMSDNKQLTELSDKTLSNYTNKSYSSQNDAKKTGNKKKEQNRIKGRTTANMRLSGFGPKNSSTMKEELSYLEDDDLAYIIASFTAPLNEEEFDMFEDELLETIEENVLEDLEEADLNKYIHYARMERRRQKLASDLHRNVGNDAMADAHYAEFKKRDAGIRRALKKIKKQ
jgi:hypothetical protein